MKGKKKWMPHIIAVVALAVFIILGLACATTKKMSKSEIEGKAITAPVLMLTGEDNPILVIPWGTCIVRSVNGIAISSSAFTGWGATMKTTYYRIPSGNVRLRIDPYNHTSGFRSTDVEFNATLGNVYQINIIGALLQFLNITTDLDL